MKDLVIPELTSRVSCRGGLYEYQANGLVERARFQMKWFVCDRGEIAIRSTTDPRADEVARGSFADLLDCVLSLRGRMTSRIAASTVLLALHTAPAVAQVAGPAALHVGVGNVFGGFGVAGESVVRGRLSAALGIGVMYVDPTSAAVAAAVRLYTSRNRHSPFLQLSIAPLAVTIFCANECGVERTHYGPGIVLGYRYVAGSGFTLTTGAGAGWVVDEGYPLPMVQLGFGYAFKRRPP